MQKCSLVLLLILLLCACAPVQSQPTAPPSPIAVATPITEALPLPAGPRLGGALTFAMKEDITSINPLRAIQYGDIRLNSLVVQQLVAPDLNGKFVGVLAESWNVSADGKKWVFHLRQNVHFHNGQEMTAADVVYIFNYILDQNTGSVMYTTFTNIGLQVKKLDDYTVQMTIDSGMGPFLSYLGLLNRAAILHQDSFNPDGSASHLIGTGPFMMQESQPGEYYRLEKFPDYWKEGQPYLDEVILRVITDPNVRLNAIRTGEVDMTEELPVADVQSLMLNPDPNFITQVYYFNSGERFVLNHTRPPFNNLNARLAVAYAFDRKAYNDAVYFGLGQVHNQPFVQSDTWYLDVPVIEPDLDKARQYFKTSGLPEGTRVAMLLMNNQRDAAEIVSMMLSQVGFDVQYNVVDSNTWTERGKILDYDILIGTMTGIFDPDRPYGYLESSSSGNWLVGGYDNPTMTTLLETGRLKTNPYERKEIYQQVLQLAQDDVATLYICGLPWVEAWRNNVKGYQPGNAPMLMMMDASDGLNTTWLER